VKALSDADADARHEPRQLAVDERMVVPAGAVVKMIVTSNDVVHAWGIPGFWTKIDAVPGRLNETWFRADRPGLYYGVCYELCGARHGYMPIAIEAVSRPKFEAWIRSKGGTLGGEAAAAAPAAAPSQEPESSVEGAPGAGAAPSPAPVSGTTAPN
jgi:cytochrome c oxidase subunit 2